jgi:hypothetical protein
LVANVFFHKDSSTLEIVDEQGLISESGLLYCKLKALLHDGKINEAENLLFKEVEQNATAENMMVAVQFYNDLQQFDDSSLLNCDFSRQEIVDGIKAIRKIFEHE